MENLDPVTVYGQFLETLSLKIDNLCSEDCEIPFRVTNSSLVPSELEGECLEWIRRCLLTYECPYGLISQLAQAVLKSFLSTVNLKDFYLESDDTDSNDNEGHGRDGDSCSSGDDDEDNKHNLSNIIQLSSLKILPELLAHLHTTVKAWSIAPPVFSKPPVKIHVCTHAIKNTRRKMEDRHVVLTDLNILFDLKDCASQSYFAVFDGHGGLEAADYAAKHYHCHLVADENFNLDPALAIKQAYKSTDIRFLEKAKRESLRSGTTGVNALIRENKLYIGWLGDSQAMLVRGGQAVQVMTPHKPEREDERQRIEDLGGCVVFFGAWRVNGNISVSRAIGDVAHKPFISSDADVITVVMNGEEEYLVLACDGLWDVVSPAQVVQIVYKHANSSPGGLEDVAIGLVNAARDLGSSDNISVIVVFFKSSLSKPQPPQESALFNFQDVSSSSDNGNNASSTTSTSLKEPKMNERLSYKPNNQSSSNRDSVTLTDGSSLVYSHSNDVEDSKVEGMLFKEGCSFGGSGGGGESNSSNDFHPVNLWLNQTKTSSFSSRVLEAPYSHDLVRQAMFYISPRADARIMSLALNKAMRGDRSEKKKKNGASLNSSSGSFSRQSSFSRSPRRLSVRPLSKASHFNVGKARGDKGHKIIPGSRKDLKMTKTRRRSGTRLASVNKRTKITLDDTDDTDDDQSSIASYDRFSHRRPLSRDKTSISVHEGLDYLAQPLSGRLNSKQATLHITGSQFSNSVLETSHWPGGVKNFPKKSGKSLNVPGNRNVLPGITSLTSCGSKKKNLAEESFNPHSAFSKSSKEGKALSVVDDKGLDMRPRLWRGLSVMSDSFAVTNRGSGGNVSGSNAKSFRSSYSHLEQSGAVTSRMPIDSHSSRPPSESGPKTSRQVAGVTGQLAAFKWER